MGARPLFWQCCFFCNLKAGCYATGIFALVVLGARFIIHLLPIVSLDVAGVLAVYFINWVPATPLRALWIVLCVLEILMMLITLIMLFAVSQNYRGKSMLWVFMISMPTYLVLELVINIYTYAVVGGLVDTIEAVLGGTSVGAEFFNTIIRLSPIYLLNILVWVIPLPLLIYGLLCVISWYRLMRWLRKRGISWREFKHSRNRGREWDRYSDSSSGYGGNRYRGGYDKGSDYGYNGRRGYDQDRVGYGGGMRRAFSDDDLRRPKGYYENRAYVIDSPRMSPRPSPVMERRRPYVVDVARSYDDFTYPVVKRTIQPAPVHTRVVERVGRPRFRNFDPYYGNRSRDFYYKRDITPPRRHVTSRVYDRY